MTDEGLTVLVVGAHPDDCDLKAGGVACLYADQGHDVRFVSMTDGSAGHHVQGGRTLVQRRQTEAERAAEAAGIEYETLGFEDGKLEPTLAARERVIELVRRIDPDLLLTHRPNDYHPDHRYTSRLVQDASYMVRVPNVCPDVTPLDADPVVAYLEDDFQKPAPFEPDVVVSVDGVRDQKFEMLHQHESQVYEWLPHVEGITDMVPEGDEARRKWLEAGGLPHVGAMRAVADRFREQLIERYGPERGEAVQHAEAFEACEYGAPLTGENVDRLFPFE